VLPDITLYLQSILGSSRFAEALPARARPCRLGASTTIPRYLTGDAR
jgi:hypothetical protein